MGVLYHPSGRAEEYSKWALNVYNGCEHGCIYCYVPAIVRKSYKQFSSGTTPRANVVRLLEKDLKEFSEIEIHAWEYEDPVLLSFTCDPYQPVEAKHRITRQCIELFNEYHVPVQVLTKGCDLALDDLDLLSQGDFNMFATSLTHTDNDFLSKMEPRASTYEDRIAALMEAKELGIKTWVSLEPVVVVEETLEIIRDTYEVVDKFKVGKLNHDPYGGKIDWPDFRERAVALLEELNCDYYLKKDLREA